MPNGLDNIAADGSKRLEALPPDSILEIDWPQPHQPNGPFPNLPFSMQLLFDLHERNGLRVKWMKGGFGGAR